MASLIHRPRNGWPKTAPPSQKNPQFHPLGGFDLAVMGGVDGFNSKELIAMITTKHITDTLSKIKQDTKSTTRTKNSTRIKVTVHIPKNVHEPIRQQKINKIYDILSPKTSL